MNFEPHSVLITGGAGFIGANFVRYWIDTKPGGKVVVFDALTYAGRIENLKGLEHNPRFAFVQGDICDQSSVLAAFDEHQIDTVVHFAAESHVDRSILGPDDFIRTNVVGTHVMLKTAKAAWLDSGGRRPHRFHHVSTDEVYGSLSADEPPFHETTPYAPNSPYSASKAASDHLVRAYRETYGLDTTVTNCSNNYGPYQFPEKLIPLMIVNILLGRSLPIYGDGHQIRDWLHVEDHCRGIALAVTRGDPGEVYNLGGNAETRNIDVVRMLCGLIDHKIAERPSLAKLFPATPVARGGRSDELISYVRDRPGHDRRYAIDFRKADRCLGYRPNRDLTQGLSDTLDWYLNNVDWWHPLLGGEYSAWIDENYKRS